MPGGGARDQTGRWIPLGEGARFWSRDGLQARSDLCIKIGWVWASGAGKKSNPGTLTCPLSGVRTCGWSHAPALPRSG